MGMVEQAGVYDSTTGEWQQLEEKSQLSRFRGLQDNTTVAASAR